MTEQTANFDMGDCPVEAVFVTLQRIDTNLAAKGDAYMAKRLRLTLLVDSWFDGIRYPLQSALVRRYLYICFALIVISNLVFVPVSNAWCQPMGYWDYWVPLLNMRCILVDCDYVSSTRYYRCEQMPDNYICPETSICKDKDGVYESPQCRNGTQDANEDGVDCGGVGCDDNPCQTPQPPVTCSDGMQSADETGIDCGGNCPTPCRDVGPDQRGNCAKQHCSTLKDGSCPDGLDGE